MKPQEQFLRIQWDEVPESSGTVTLEATLCWRHRQEIALAYTTARGSGRLGQACDFCEGHAPARRFEVSPGAPQSARVP